MFASGFYGYMIVTLNLIFNNIASSDDMEDTIMKIDYWLIALSKARKDIDLS